MRTVADMIVHGAKITTLEERAPLAEAFAVAGERFLAVGGENEVMGWRGPDTVLIDVAGRRVIPGLNDSRNLRL